ncbi:MAG TPA: flagellar biosynthetic protein FliR [Alphaproteobacteria bacterium]|nr:flagellar biosynthetic protein FliR [Alphaproteobacteria bacterium]
MTSLHLDKFLSGHVFGFLFIFSRIGCILMLFPGIGETYVSARIRMMLALAVSFLLMGPLLPRIPAPPEQIPDMVQMLAYEIIIGLFFGTVLRMLMSTLEAAGSVISLQTGLSNATILSPSLATQSPLANAFLSIVGTTLIFVTGLDAMLLRSMVETYDLFPPGGQMMPGDIAQSIIQLSNKSFVVGVEMAMPFFIMGLLMYVALGILQKLMPQVQLFLVAMPIQIWGGLTLFALTLASMMEYWLRYVDTTVGAIFVH